MTRCTDALTLESRPFGACPALLRCPFGTPTRRAGHDFALGKAGLLRAFFRLRKPGVGYLHGGTSMTNAELEIELKKASTDERILTKRIVELVAEALRRRLWAGRGYSSAHRWLVGEFGYSDSSAVRRLDAARVLVDVPEVAEKIATGALTLASLSQLQSTFHREEKRTGEKLTAELKKEVVRKIENQSSAATARTVAAEFPEVSKAPRESLRPAGANEWTLTVGLDAEQKAALDRARELLSHSHPGATWAEVIAHLANEHARRVDPVARAERRATREMPQGFTATEDRPPPTVGRLPRAVRDSVLAKAGGACEFADPQTGARCGSRVRVEADHVLPRALGGTDEASNLRCLCAQHNRCMSERELGLRWASAWGRKSGAG